MASPSSPHAEGGAISAGATAAVCCMCGDQGLPGELVRCRRCRVRLQHRYCSDLYPRAAAYGRCNWCLREPAASDDQQGRPAVVAANKAEERRRKAASGSSDEERRRQQRQRHEGCSSRRPPAELGHPVKKKHKAAYQEKMPSPPPPPPPPKKDKADHEKMSPPPPSQPAPAKNIVAEASGRKEVMRAGKTRVNRVKVRRYKLLAEVISC